MAHADLVIVPTRPSPHDLRAVGATVDIAERHGKPLIFVINAATARARITGESAVALSQHGTVAPVTIHHRVDFAASMIDGRTVGEVTPSSQSAREISDLWLYIQERLSRIVRDPSLLPEIKPGHLAINSLLSSGMEGPVDNLPPVLEMPLYDGPERRIGERRMLLEPRAHERRVFGRARSISRNGDQMSSAKFAPITANFWRAGQAQRNTVGNSLGTQEAEKVPLTGAPRWRWRPPPPPPARTNPAPCACRRMIKELGILAVKSGVSRQQLLKDAGAIRPARPGLAASVWAPQPQLRGEG